MGIAHCRRCAARTDHRHLAARQYAEPGKEVRAVAGPVGIVAITTAVPEQHGIDRAEPRGDVGQLIEQGHHRLLEGMGDVDPVEPERGQHGEELAEIPGSETHGLAIENAIDHRQAQCAGFALMHLGAARSANAQADKAAEDGRAGGRRNGDRGLQHDFGPWDVF